MKLRRRGYKHRSFFGFKSNRKRKLWQTYSKRWMPF